MKVKVICLIILNLFLYSQRSYGQQQQVQEIDSLFHSWNQNGHPGGVVTIIKDGKTFFSKAYGLANIEYDVLNSIGTVFNIASISKQFTAMGIVLLEEQNKLNYKDDVRKYLPELPDFGTTITIRQLLQHTSGLRDIHGLLGLAGWRSNDLETNEDLYRIIKNQKELNFRPEEEFLYCNTGYILLAKIIENISELPFDKYMKKFVFDPLGMRNTYVETQVNRTVSNNATSYYSYPNFDRAIEYWGYYGAGNMHSNTKDLGLWLQNFVSPQKNWEAAFNSLLTTSPLKNGFKTNYGFGVRIEKSLGKKVIQHGGAVGGFRGIVRTYPEENLHIIILTNFSESRIGSKINTISRIILEKQEETQINNSSEESLINTKPINLAIQENKEVEGIYWSNSEKSGRKIYVKNDTLRYASSESNEWALVPLGDKVFQMIHPYSQLILVEFNGSGQMTVKAGNDMPGFFNLIQSDINTNTDGLNMLIGKYYSDELKAIYSISLREGKLFIDHARHGRIELTQLYNDKFSGVWPINIIEFERNKDGKVEGLRISNGRTRNVWFKKMQ
ncbi:class A beta-lactamase-related serine hydrolase [Maribacter algicola]|uniref:Class A beta-lactamase-related serine hydrolase n=1 Tax=Maribacter algicola TaxID=2498892 RepID=A0A3R8PWS5_9FLAO|nr:serine hydrolase domain-containing protein [Maribacter algicola]RRQ48167.1 class A beta-lactamase-related serine hydrolase [Maribacter algicola]